jgi:hypothetical protein
VGENLKQKREYFMQKKSGAILHESAVGMPNWVFKKWVEKINMVKKILHARVRGETQNGRRGGGGLDCCMTSTANPRSFYSKRNASFLGD